MLNNRRLGLVDSFYDASQSVKLRGETYSLRANRMTSIGCKRRTNIVKRLTTNLVVASGKTLKDRRLPLSKLCFEALSDTGKLAIEILFLGTVLAEFKEFMSTGPLAGIVNHKFIGST